MEEDKSFSVPSSEENNHGWQKVTYAKKRNNKSQSAKANSDPARVVANGSADKNGAVFKNLEKHAEERRRKLEQQRAAAVYDDEDDVPVRSKKKWGDDDNDDDASDADGNVKENNAAEVKKKEKPKKEKKLKVTVAEAAAKIDPSDLEAFLSNVSGSYEGQQDIQLMRFADYFGRAFSAVSGSQFPWLKLFRESALSKIADVPVSYISEAVYKISVDWINHHSSEALGSFVLWSLDGILADLAHQQTGSKGSKKGGQPTSSKSQVAIFLVLAMVLRRKPDVLITILPKLRETPKYQGQDKLPVIVWMIVQACQGDLAVGLYLWSHHVLPILGGKSGSNPHSRDLVLQLVEKILSGPKAHTILVNGAVRKGERLIPPTALDLLLRVTFPASSARVRATERFEAIYPTLKEVALSGSPGSRAMRQVSLQIQTLAFEAAGEGVPELAREATDIFLWCLIQNPECYRQWEKVYMDNIEASVAALKKLAESWKGLSAKLSSLDTVRATLTTFRQKNEQALNGEVDVASQAFFKDADKYCKVLLGRLSRGYGCVTIVVFAIVVAMLAVLLSPNITKVDWKYLDFSIVQQISATFKKIRGI